MGTSFRTDLAREACKLYGRLDGVTEDVRQVNGVTLSHVRIHTEAAAEKLGKRVGSYITIEQPDDLSDHAKDVVAAVLEALSEILPESFRHVLVIGLGNRFITPDALGPRTAERILVTRHIALHLPKLALPGMRHVSSFTPGVLGVTGMETAEIVRGVIRAVRPDALLCIDALAADAPQHIGRTVQLNDNGLLPGAGVNNRQRELNEAALGLPVFAAGVPTVVSAVSIARETARLMAAESGDTEHAETLADLGERVTASRMGELIVTPKDVDKLIDDASRRLSEGVNRALHGAQYDELLALTEG